MKKIRNISACLVMFMAGISLFSCSSEDSTQYATSGKLGEISVDRTKIGTHQWFTVKGSYVNGSGLTAEKLYFSTDDNLPASVTVTNGELSTSVHFTKPGKHTVTFSAVNDGLFTDNVYQQKVEKTKEIEVVASDIRCHFWKETREETLQNLAHYKTLKESGNDLTISESDLYGDIDYSSEAKGDYSQSSTTVYDLKAERTVFYKFDEDNKLDEIQYICKPQDQSVGQYVSAMLSRVNSMKKEYNLIEYTYNASSVNLTQEEMTEVKNCIEQINSGNHKDIDPEGKIGNIIKNKGLMLIGEFISKDNKTKGAIATYYQDGQFSILMQFDPME